MADYVDPRRPSDFWDTFGKAAPGMFGTAAGLWAKNAAQKEAEDRLRQVQDPLYAQQQAAAQKSLALAGSMDPKALAAERLKAEQDLLAPKDAADLTDLQQRLYTTGTAGLGTYNSGSGTPGMLVNPGMNAYYAAKMDRDRMLAADALNQGESYLDRLNARAGTLQNQAIWRQRANMEAQRTIPTSTDKTLELLKSGIGMAKDFGLFGKGLDWLRGQFGGGGQNIVGDNPFGGFSDTSIANTDFNPFGSDTGGDFNWIWS